MTLYMKIANSLFMLAIIVIVVACSPNRITNSDVSGLYVFRYKNGEIELLVLNADSTYDHFLYRSADDAKANDEPKFKFHGQWTSNQGVVDLAGWMLLADYSNLSDPLNQPRPFTSLRGYWYRSNDSKTFGLLISEDTGYNFLKIQGREQIK